MMINNQLPLILFLVSFFRIGDKAFSVIALKLLNELPSNIAFQPFICQFKSSLKTHLLFQCLPSRRKQKTKCLALPNILLPSHAVQSHLSCAKYRTESSKALYKTMHYYIIKCQSSGPICMLTTIKFNLGALNCAARILIRNH